MRETENFKSISQTVLKKELKYWIICYTQDHGEFSEMLGK